VSAYARGQLIGIPKRTYGGTRTIVREIYVPAGEVDVGALKKVLGWVRRCYQHFPCKQEDETPQILLARDADIKTMCDLYQVYLFLGMGDRPLQLQDRLVAAIKKYFASDHMIKAAEVLYFCRACKKDAVLSWRVMRQVQDCVQKCRMGGGDGFRYVL
jgi:hypothetical protein